VEAVDAQGSIHLRSAIFVFWQASGPTGWDEDGSRVFILCGDGAFQRIFVRPRPCWRQSDRPKARGRRGSEDEGAAMAWFYKIIKMVPQYLGLL